MDVPVPHIKEDGLLLVPQERVHYEAVYTEKVFTVKMRHHRDDQACVVDTVGFIKRLDKHNMPRSGDCPRLRSKSRLSTLVVQDLVVVSEDRQPLPWDRVAERLARIDALDTGVRGAGGRGGGRGGDPRSAAFAHPRRLPSQTVLPEPHLQDPVPLWHQVHFCTRVPRVGIVARRVVRSWVFRRMVKCTQSLSRALHVRAPRVR